MRKVKLAVIVAIILAAMTLPVMSPVQQAKAVDPCVCCAYVPHCCFTCWLEIAFEYGWDPYPWQE